MGETRGLVEGAGIGELTIEFLDVELELEGYRVESDSVELDAPPYRDEGIIFALAIASGFRG